MRAGRRPVNVAAGTGVTDARVRTPAACLALLIQLRDGIGAQPRQHLAARQTVARFKEWRRVWRGGARTNPGATDGLQATPLVRSLSQTTPCRRNSMRGWCHF